MIPTEENIREVAEARIAAIRSKARELGDVESTDRRLLDIIVRDALHKVTTLRHPPATAQAAVQWAISDMYTEEVSDGNSNDS